jgi:hypothetical protein
MNFKKHREIKAGQLITDNKKLTALANLYHSLVRGETCGLKYM